VQLLAPAARSPLSGGREGSASILARRCHVGCGGGAGGGDEEEEEGAVAGLAPRVQEEAKRAAVGAEGASASVPGGGLAATARCAPRVGDAAEDAGLLGVP